MINHGRSLLLNRSGSAKGFLARPGEEFIPPDFSSVELPTYLTAIRRVLFGHQPDWLFENYRTRQYMSLLHSTELVEFLTQLDPRITYDVEGNDLFSESVFTAHVENEAESIRFVGTAPAPDDSGQAYRRWKVAVIDHNYISVTKLGSPPVEQQFTYTSDGTWSSLIPLGSSAFFVSVKPVPLREWRVIDAVRPQRSLGEIAATIEQVPGGHLIELFGDGTPQGDTEPWQTFRNLWFSHPTLAYRLGGLLLAFIYRTDERRRNRA